MDQINAARRQLQQASSLAQVLAADLEALDLLAAACQDGSRELFAAYAFAATAATEAQIAIARAPSLPDPRSRRDRTRAKRSP